MNVFRFYLSGFVLGVDQPAALRTAQVLQAFASSCTDLEVADLVVTEVKGREMLHLPAAVVRLLERETKAKNGPAASAGDVRELYQAVAAATGGDVTGIADEVDAIKKAFSYVPRSWVEHRTTLALQRATAPEVSAA